MRRAAALALVVVAFAVPAVDGHGTSRVEELRVLVDSGPFRLVPGASMDLKYVVERLCPASGTLYVDVKAEDGLEATTKNPTLDPCGSEDHTHAASRVHVRALDSAKAGPLVVAIAAWMDDGAQAADGFSVHVPYFASARVSGPDSGLALPRQEVPVALNVTASANGPTRVILTHDAPPGFRIRSPDYVDLPYNRSAQTVPWNVKVQAPSGASGDVTIHFRALPKDRFTGTELGAPGELAWTLRLPSTGSTPRPVSPAGSGTADPAPDVPEPPPGPVRPDDGGDLPGWSYGAIVAVAAAASLVLVRRFRP